MEAEMTLCLLKNQKLTLECMKFMKPRNFELTTPPIGCLTGWKNFPFRQNNNPVFLILPVGLSGLRLFLCSPYWLHMLMGRGA